MHYTCPTYRPPYEAESLLLQVTAGCSHNKCTFCSMYQDVPFEVSPIEEVEEDLVQAARYGEFYDRVFLVNGDAFCLSFERLVEIAELVHRYLPRIESIGGYASINNVLAKTEDELRETIKTILADDDPDVIRERKQTINDLDFAIKSLIKDIEVEEVRNKYKIFDIKEMIEQKESELKLYD